MSDAYSLHIGVNRVDPAHYGSDAPLRGCENDARDMQSIARSLGYQSEVLLTEQARSEHLFERLSSAAATLVAGDTYLLTIASHGSQVPDLLIEETDGQDETWCLYDRMVMDDEIYNALSRFRRGVRVLVVVDACHSASSVRAVLEAQRKSRGVMRALGFEEDVIFRCIDPILSAEAFTKSKPFYTAIKSNVAVRELRADGPDIVLLSACQDNQLAGDGPTNGLFTQNLKAVWNGGSFAGDYEAFRNQIKTRINSPSQVPGLLPIGANSAAVVRTKPFSLGGSGGRDVDDSSGMTESVARCFLEFPSREILGRPRLDVQRYVNEAIMPTLIDTCIEAAAGSVSPRALPTSSRGGWEVSCEKTWGGETKCSVKVGGSF